MAVVHIHNKDMKFQTTLEEKAILKTISYIKRQLHRVTLASPSVKQFKYKVINVHKLFSESKFRFKNIQFRSDSRVKADPELSYKSILETRIKNTYFKIGTLPSPNERAVETLAIKYSIPLKDARNILTSNMHLCKVVFNHSEGGHELEIIKPIIDALSLRPIKVEVATDFITRHPIKLKAVLEKRLYVPYNKKVFSNRNKTIYSSTRLDTDTNNKIPPSALTMYVKPDRLRIEYKRAVKKRASIQDLLANINVDYKLNPFICMKYEADYLKKQGWTFKIKYKTVHGKEKLKIDNCLLNILAVKFRPQYSELVAGSW